MLRKKSIFITLLMLLWAFPANAENSVRIVTTTNTFASITQTIAGDLATIHYVASPKRNVHFITPTPKDVLKVKKADVFIHGGLDLELWRDPLLEAAGNQAFLGNGESSINVSKGITFLEVPTHLSRSEGDIHQFGNPHYWVDPENGKIIAQNITEGLSKLFPEKRTVFEANLKNFIEYLDQKIADWQKRMKPFNGTSVVTYHKSWPYFANRFKFEIVGHIEPKPGIAPTPKHMNHLITLMQQEDIKVILKESFQESRTPKKIAAKTGAVVLTLADNVGATKGTADYIQMIEYNIRQFETMKDPIQGDAS